VVARIPAGGEGGWDYASFDPVKRRLYVTRGMSVMALEVDSGRVRLNLARANRGHEALPVSGGRELLITSSGDQTASLVNADTGQVRATVSTSAGPDAAVLEPSTGLAAVMGNKSGVVDLIDVASGTAAGAIEVGGALESAAADGRGHVFVAVEDRNQIAEIDVAGRRLVARHPLEGCDGPTGLAYIARHRALLAACGNEVAELVSARTGRVLQRLKIGRRPDAAFYDPARDRAFIPTGGDGALAVIGFSGDKARVVQTVATAPGARLGAVDPKTGRVYLPAGRYQPPATPGGRPSLVPGSFELLVVG
jgi:hypothetical protein